MQKPVVFIARVDSWSSLSKASIHKAVDNKGEPRKTFEILYFVRFKDLKLPIRQHHDSDSGILNALNTIC